MTEPNPDIGPVREFIGGEQAVFANLAEARTEIEVIDACLVAFLESRAECVRQAALFKNDVAESTAPERQKTNIENAVRLAEETDSKLPGFTEIVGDIFKVLVPASVAAQHRVLSTTYLRTEGHRMEPEIWDMGGIPNYREDIIKRWERKAS